MVKYDCYATYCKLLCISQIPNSIVQQTFNNDIPANNMEIEFEYEVFGYHPNGFGEELIQPTWYYSYSSDVDVDGDPTNGISGGFQADDFNGQDGYNYKYDFENALQDGIIRPPLPSTPAVFELKNSNQNVKGRVR